MRNAIPLLFVALVVAGCGRTYSVAETRAALAAEGIKTPDENNGIGSMLNLNFFNEPCAAEPRPFPSLNLAIEDLRFDVGTGNPQFLFQLPRGMVYVYCNRYDAVQQTRFITLLEHRLASRPANLPRYVFRLAGTKAVRHGNVVLVENGPQPQLEAALARLH